MQILLLCATKTERSGLNRLFNIEKTSYFESGFSFFKIKEESIYLGQTGIGWDITESFLEKLDQISLKFDVIIQFGLSGGLDSSIKETELILPNEIKSTQEFSSYSVDQKLLDLVQSILKDKKIFYNLGSLLTSKEVISFPKDKEASGEKYQSLAVDMESYPTVRYAKQKKISYLSLRVCFDEVDLDLSKLEDADLVNQDGNLNSLHLVSGVAKNPKLIFQLPKFQKISSQGMNKIYQVLTLLIDLLKEEANGAPKDPANHEE